LPVTKLAGESEWDIIEVKGTAGVRDIHFDDVSYQKYCCDRSGLKIRKCFPMYVNNEYVREGEIEPEKYSTMQDTTAEVEESSKGIQDRIDTMLGIISASQCPEIAIGKHCSVPYDCPLTECWDFLPDGSVFDPYRGGNKHFELFEQGVLAIQDIPDDYSLTPAQVRAGAGAHHLCNLTPNWASGIPPF